LTIFFDAIRSGNGKNRQKFQNADGDLIPNDAKLKMSSKFKQTFELNKRLINF